MVVVEEGELAEDEEAEKENEATPLLVRSSVGDIDAVDSHVPMVTPVQPQERRLQGANLVFSLLLGTPTKRGSTGIDEKAKERN